jgi:hypothetical protein
MLLLLLVRWQMLVDQAQAWHRLPPQHDKTPIDDNDH